MLLDITSFIKDHFAASKHAFEMETESLGVFVHYTTDFDHVWWYSLELKLFVHPY